jgi:hypothetical protein
MPPLWLRMVAFSIVYCLSFVDAAEVTCRTTVTVHIEPGMAEGHPFVFKGQAEQVVSHLSSLYFQCIQTEGIYWCTGAGCCIGGRGSARGV